MVATGHSTVEGVNPNVTEDGAPPHRVVPSKLDARGLLCPMPVIRTQDEIKTLAVGDVLEVVATDPGVLHDIPAWCRVHGHRVLATETHDDEYRFRIEVT